MWFRAGTTPPAISVDEFWATIDTVWASIESGHTQCLLSSKDSKKRHEAAAFIEGNMLVMLPHLGSALEAYSLVQLRAWKDHFRDARIEIEQTTGITGDDHWTDRCAFIIGAGRTSAQLFIINPTKYRAMFHTASREEMGYVALMAAQSRWGSVEALHDDAAAVDMHAASQTV